MNPSRLTHCKVSQSPNFSHSRSHSEHTRFQSNTSRSPTLSAERSCPSILTIGRQATLSAPITALTKCKLSNCWKGMALPVQQGSSWRTDGTFSGRLSGGLAKGTTIADVIYFSGTSHTNDMFLGFVLSSSAHPGMIQLHGVPPSAKSKTPQGRKGVPGFAGTPMISPDAWLMLRLLSGRHWVLNPISSQKILKAYRKVTLN